MIGKPALLIITSASILAGCVERDVPETARPIATPVAVRSSVMPPAATDTVASVGGSVTVKPHQTLYAVARQTGVPLRSLIEANGLKPPYRVHAGETLTVPNIRQHMVQPGETLYAVSRRYGVEATTLAQLNHLQPPYVIKRGMPLVLPPAIGVARIGAPASRYSMPQGAGAATLPPRYVAAAPISGGAIEAAPLAPPELGKTSAAPPTASDPSKLAAATSSSLNGKNSTAILPPITTQATLLPLPSKTVASVDAATLGGAAPKLQDDGADTEDAGTAPAPSAATGSKAAAIASGDVAASVRSHRPPGDPLFYWPARGKIIAVFGPTRGGTHNDGINIAAPEGTVVSAAESGVVAYAGDQLKGFGNLLLIKHDSGWVSAYAHNQVLLVNKGDRVRRGQPIARVGSTGGVSQPQLHFELREGVKAVDPLDHLPQLATASG